MIVIMIVKSLFSQLPLFVHFKDISPVCSHGILECPGITTYFQTGDKFNQSPNPNINDVILEFKRIKVSVVHE